MLVGDNGPALFRRAKGVVEMLARHCQIADLRLEPVAAGAAADVDGPGWADRQARLALRAGDGRRVGTLSLLSTRCRTLAGIESGVQGVQVACFEVDLDALRLNTTRENDYRPVSPWPEGEFDLSVIVPEHTTWAQLSASAAGVGSGVGGGEGSGADNLVERIAYIGEFRGGPVPAASKSVTLRVTLRPRTGTLDGAQIAACRAEVIAALGRDLGAELRA